MHRLYSLVDLFYRYSVIIYIYIYIFCLSFLQRPPLFIIHFLFLMLNSWKKTYSAEVFNELKTKYYGIRNLCVSIHPFFFFSTSFLTSSQIYQIYLAQSTSTASLQWSKTLSTSFLDMTLNNLMMRLQSSWNFR